MTTNSREKDFQAKQEFNTNEGKITKGSSSSRPWSGLKDPRIVRVSRSFGGKDRHSKVCTIRGLRDRRVRLSVPTAIQLYDLQDRLGFNQPSKVVDWLLNATRHEIDELPPLPPGSFDQYPQTMTVSHEVSAPQSSLSSFVDANTEYVKDDGSHTFTSSKGGFNIINNVVGEDQTTFPKSTYWNSDATFRSTSKEVARETITEKSNWIKRNEHERQEGVEVHSANASVHSPLPRASHSSLPGSLNSVIPYNSYYHWEPSNLSLSHLGSHGYLSQTEDPHNYNVVSMPSSLSLPSGSQLLVCPSITTPSFFPPYVTTTPIEYDPRQINHFQMLSSSSQNLFPSSLAPSFYSISPPVRPFQLITPKPLPSQNNNGNQPNKGNNGSSSPFT